MKPFLSRVASLFYDTYGVKVSRKAFVFPNKRTGLFFRKYLSEIAGKPLFSPTILTISDLFFHLSGKQPADRIYMLLTLYKIYIRKSGSAESFDEFLYWGEMLLNDFDDVDKYMANARMLFTNVTDLKEIEADFYFLNENQIAAIRTFWSSFTPGSENPNQENFLTAWKVLYELYLELKEILSAESLGYEGMIFREVVEGLKKEGGIDLPWDEVVFVGLNALSTVEEQFLSELQKRDLADFYWDYEAPEIRDADNKASFFAAGNIRMYPSRLTLPEDDPVEREIEVIGIPSGIGQAKQLYSILEEYCKEGMDNEKALRTAVILPDEHLLIPVLHSIPEQIRHINVTMGYPLSGTPVASLMEYILHLQRNIRFSDGQPSFYYRDVLPVLNHRYILSTAPDVVNRLVQDITKYNKIYISREELNHTALLDIIFSPVIRPGDFPEYMIRVLEKLNYYIGLSATSENEDEPEKDLTFVDVEQEFIFHYFTTVNRMNDVMKESDVEVQLNTWYRLLKRVTESITIPFRGEPLSGLQIMGVLETRALDFDRVIILSMNEGIFPLKKAANSFIPYNLRRGFGLPTYEHQDSIWAYHFYRLIARAKQVTLLYDTRSTGLLSGEKSRYIYQLHYHYEVPLRNKLVVYNVSSSRKPEITIQKTDEVMMKLSAFYEGGERALSASSINTYLDCPLKFYFQVVEDVQEEDEVNETIESDIFGSILHKVLEDVYKPFKGNMVMADVLKALEEKPEELTSYIEQAFAELFFKTEHVRRLTGRNYLIGEMIRKYARKVLSRDRKLTPFRYLESERKINDLFSLTNGYKVNLKGFIDRVDEIGGETVRIIDYKSGKGTRIFTSIESLFDKEDKDRAKAVMQVFMYAWMYNRTPEGTGRLIKPGIYYMREIFNNPFEWEIFYRLERGKKTPVEAFVDYSADFEKGLRNCLDELFNKNIPFGQTTQKKGCSWCPFKDICGAS